MTAAYRPHPAEDLLERRGTRFPPPVKSETSEPTSAPGRRRAGSTKARLVSLTTQRSMRQRSQSLPCSPA
jgi:hypothetical protein